MTIKIIGLALLSLFFFVNCESERSAITEVAKNPVLTKAEQVFNKSLAAHGGKLYEDAHYEFTFRGKQYTFKNMGDHYAYTLEYEKNDTTIVDLLDNNSFVRKVNGEVEELTEKKDKAGREALNSVIYFATLPHKLQDKAVNKSYAGTINIKGKAYEVLKVTFEEEGGGTDFDDTYHYWINEETGLIDYLAYNYTVNGGGVRFRAANNTRKVDGIVFQDYVNYKAELGTALSNLPGLWEKGELKKLSDINTESVKSLRLEE